MSKIKLSDRTLRAAAAEYRNAMLSAFPEPEEMDFEPSPRYKANMARLLRKMERKESFRRHVRSAAAVVLVLTLGVGAFISLNGKARAGFTGWVIATYENSIIYKHPAADSNAPLPRCELTWIPDGYELTVCDSLDDSLTMVYESDDGNVFIFACDRMTDSNLLQVGVTKEFSRKNVSVNGFNAELFRFEDGKLTLIWYDNKSEFIYSLDSTFDEDSVLLHIAKNVKITK